MKKHIDFRIYGKVHGVGFRFSCKEIAYHNNIKGNVQNKADGSVYIEAEGEDHDLETFRAWCHKGPFWARVSRVVENPGKLKNFDSFEIIR